MTKMDTKTIDIMTCRERGKQGNFKLLPQTFNFLHLVSLRFRI